MNIVKEKSLPLRRRDTERSLTDNNKQQQLSSKKRPQRKNRSSKSREKSFTGVAEEQ